MQFNTSMTRVMWNIIGIIKVGFMAERQYWIVLDCAGFGHQVYYPEFSRVGSFKNVIIMQP